MYISETKNYEIHMSSDDLNNLRLMLDNYVDKEAMSHEVKKFYDKLRDEVVEFV